MNILANAKSWASSPYDDKMSVGKWFLFVGLLMVIGIIWTVIIKHLTD